MPARISQLMVLLAVVLLASTACGGGSGNAGGEDAQQQVQMGIGLPGPETHPYSVGALRFQELVEEKSGGQIEVDLFLDGTLGGEREIVEAVQAGTVEMGVVTSDGALPAFVFENQVFSIPYLIRDREHAYAVLDGEVGDELATLSEQEGLRTVGYWELGFRHFTNSVREVQAPEDMVGLSFRVQEAPVWTAFIQSLDATPQAIAFDELYSALQQGVVDGQENPVATIRSIQLDEVQEYLTLSAHTYAPGSVLLNPQFLDGLTDEQQQWIQEAVEETTPYQREQIEQSEEEDIEFLGGEGGMQVSEVDTEAFADATSGVAEEVSDIVPPELVEQVRNEGQ